MSVLFEGNCAFFFNTKPVNCWWLVVLEMVKGKRSVAAGSWIFSGCITKMMVTAVTLFYKLLFSDSFAKQSFLLFVRVFPFFNLLPPHPQYILI